ncbi:MAG: tRNA pseudouridine(55) synthase TruB [Acidobacteriota bacterium]|nr:tRNA pseudouridine(55) synthase TruB [Acidobacteriota bacterium]
MNKDGLLLVDKHAGCTSHDIVQQCRRLLRQKKIGHCGTLDPGATGLLVLTVGRATRLTRFLIRAPKVYEGVIRFGIETDTYDAGGETVAENPIDDLTHDAVVQAMEGFQGTLLQQAPRYSAKKKDGKRFYQLARSGEEVPESTKEVQIFEFSPQGELADGRLPFRLGCSSGTYARSMAHDLGQALGCGAHLAELRRLQVGAFRLDDAATIEELEDRRAELLAPDGAPEPGQAAGLGTNGTDTDWLGNAWIPFDRIPLPFGQVVADAKQQQRINNGQTVLVRDLEGEEGDWVQLLDQRQHFIAVGTIAERIGDRVGVIQPRVVFK